MEDTWTFISENLLTHWPFLVVTLVFTIIGKFTGSKVFTRLRAYEKRKGPWYKFWKAQWFWWWGRETLSLHPILTGAVLGLIWHNPELADPSWSLPASVGYFAGAGVSSLFSWNILRSLAKKRGIDLQLPGSSEPPGEEK
jgi:hypothetical protein